MDTITIEIFENVFYRLIESNVLKMSEITLKNKEPKDFDYSFDEKWKEAKKESDKAFRKRKEIEYKIRHK